MASWLTRLAKPDVLSPDLAFTHWAYFALHQKDERMRASHLG